MNKISVIINGANGKMGQITLTTLRALPQYEIVSQTNQHDNLSTVIQKTKAKIVIDFSTAAVGFEIAKTIINNDAHPVIGTSGFLPEQIDYLQNLAAKKQLGGIIAPNFSIGAVLMMQYAAAASRYFARAEIIEMHHDKKADAPSGTAIKTAEMLAPQEIEGLTEKETIAKVRGGQHNHIPVHSIRLPGLLAHQEVIMGNAGETLTIRHDMIHREACMPGVLLACEKVAQLTELVYGLENILDN